MNPLANLSSEETEHVLNSPSLRRDGGMSDELGVE
jgi:hypothetical protein